MVNTIKKRIFRSVYFLVSVLMLLLLFITLWYVRKDIDAETEKQVSSRVKNVALSNISVVKNIIESYRSELMHVKHALDIDRNSAKVQTTIEYLKDRDSSIASIEINSKESKPFKPYSLIAVGEGELPEVSHFAVMIPLPALNDSILTMHVKLIDLHNRIAINENLSNVYITVTSENRYVFHPNEENLGQEMNAKDISNQNKALADNKGLVKEVYSDYLDVDVYRYYKRVSMGQHEWIFTANMPNFSFQEYLHKTTNAFLLIFLVAIAAFLLILGFGVLRWRSEFMKRRNIEQKNLTLQLKNEQQKQTVISTELEILKSGLNPHFLFNSLGSLRFLVDKEPKAAKHFATTLSNIYRYMLKHEKQDTVTLREELAFVNDYIQLQKIRFANKLDVVIVLDETSMKKRLPPVSIQLLVENSIKHTIISEKAPLYINIHQQKGNIIVENNYNPRLSEAEHTGKGIENLKKRYAMLTRKKCSFSVVGDLYIASIPLLG